jgi:anti-anti-sigma regulatory factor
MFLPTFTDPEIERRARLLLLILTIVLPGISAIALIVLLLKGASSTLFLICISIIVVLFGLLALLRAGYVRSSAIGLVLTLGVANIVGANTIEFANINGAYTAYGLSNGIILLLAAFLVTWWASVPTAVLLLLGQQIGGLFFAATNATGSIEAVILLTFSLVVSLFARSLQFALDQARKQEFVAETAVEVKDALAAQLHDTSTLLDQERQLRETINQLTVPVQEVGDHVLFAPLIGYIDSARGQQISDTVLHKLHASRAHTIIIDVQGVSTIDANVARLLDHLIQAIQLLGARVMLTGISAEMAATITRLGITFRNIALYPSVSSALQAMTTNGNGNGNGNGIVSSYKPKVSY